MESKTAGEALKDFLETVSGSQECGAGRLDLPEAAAAAEPELQAPTKEEEAEPAAEPAATPEPIFAAEPEPAAVPEAEAKEAVEVDEEVEAEADAEPDAEVTSDEPAKQAEGTSESAEPTDQAEDERMVGRKVRKIGKAFPECHPDEGELIWEGEVIRVVKNVGWRVLYEKQHGSKKPYFENMGRSELMLYLVDDDGTRRQREVTPVPDEQEPSGDTQGL